MQVGGGMKSFFPALGKKVVKHMFSYSTGLSVSVLGRKQARLASTALVLCASVSAFLVTQQAEAQVPGSAEPGRIEKRFEPPKKPKSIFEPVIPEMEGPMPPDEAEKVKFTLTGVTIEGSTVYGDEDFLPLYEQHLSQEISLKTVYDIAEAITAKYGEDGYALSRAFVPPQSIKNGIVRIGIIEGFIDKVIIEGELSQILGFFKKYEEKIRASRPLKSSVLERYLLLANDLPDLTVKSVLKPSKDTPGASDLIITVVEKKYDASFGIDNHGTKSQGRGQFNLGLGANSVLGLHERATFNLIKTPQERELKYFKFGYEQTLNSEGTKLSVTANRSLSRPGTDVLEAIELESKNNSWSLRLDQPIIRSRQQNLSAHVMFDYKNSESWQLGLAHPT